MSQETIKRNFTVAGPCRLSLGNIRGTVDIQPGEDGTIQVTAVKHLETGDADHTEIIMTQAADGSVSVETHYLEGSWLFFLFYRKPCRIDYTVRLPRTCSLRVSGVSSRTAVQRLEGEISISTVSGDVSLRELSGDIQIRSVSGELSGDQLSGRLRLDTVSGGAVFSACRFMEIYGSTVSGDLEIQTPLAEGPYRFNSLSAHVRLALPPGAGCVAQMSSLSGRLKTGLPSTGVQVDGGRRRVEVQGGGPEVRLNSISGDLILDLVEEADSVASNPVPTWADAAESPAIRPEHAARENRREVLEKVARGELSAEEGLRALA